MLCSPMCSFVPQRETAQAERTECSCIITATLAPHPNTLFFHSWHLIRGCTPSSDPSYEELLENKTFFFYSTKTLIFSVFWGIYSKTANTGSRNALCLEVLKTSVTLKIPNPQPQKKRKKRCRIHEQSHTQWCREQKKSIIMKYYLSTIPITWKVRNAKASSHLEEVILEPHHV